jgi:hypothetical protein
MKKSLGIIALILLGAGLVTWRVLSFLHYEVDVLPEPMRLGNRVAFPVIPAQPAVTEVPHKPVPEAAKDLNPDELVLGVEVEGEARAYPINMLSGPNREILNDTLGGRPIAATWCDLCFSGIVYSRQVDDKTLTLFVSGYLLDHNLVMQDQETKTYWSHMLGEAKAGPLKGKKLQPIAAVLTDWQSWSQHHPGGTVVVLDRNNDKYRRTALASYQDFVLGVVVKEKAAAWPLDLLAKTPLRNDQPGGEPVLVLFDPESVTARVYARELGGRLLTFHRVNDQLIDRETGSTWDAVEGRAVTGPLQGEHLTPLPAIVCYTSAWKDFYPLSQIYSAE